MSTVKSSPTVRIGRRHQPTGKATVSIEVVMTEEERSALLERLTDGKSPLSDREETIAAIGVPTEGE